jgi:hypothetical protein
LMDHIDGPFQLGDHFLNLLVFIPSGSIVFHTKCPNWNDFVLTLLYAKATYALSLSISFRVFVLLSVTSSI